MPYRFDIDSEQRVVLFEATGVFTTEELHRCIADVIADSRFEASFSHLVDLHAVTEFEGGREDVRGRAASDVRDAPFAPGAMLALVHGDASREAVRAYAGAVAAAPFCARVFGDVAAAKAWLASDGDSSATSVMVVEDHAASRAGIAALLLMEGFEVIGADSGGAAVEAFERRASDVVLVDHLLPDMGGLELLNTLKGIEPETKFLLLSGVLHIERIWKDYEDAGAIDYLGKPIDIDKLIAACS